MTRIATLIILFAVLSFATSCVPHNTCSSKDRIDMKQGGLSMEEINTACTSYKISEEFVNAAAEVAKTELTKKSQNGNQTVQQHYSVAGATACVTQYGQCPLMQPGTSGAQCVCYSMLGQIPGVMR
jgi:hypothetical protein